jgi:hypothetical protein
MGGQIGEWVKFKESQKVSHWHNKLTYSCCIQWSHLGCRFDNIREVSIVCASSLQESVLIFDIRCPDINAQDEDGWVSFLTTFDFELIIVIILLFQTPLHCASQNVISGHAIAVEISEITFSLSPSLHFFLNSFWFLVGVVGLAGSSSRCFPYIQHLDHSFAFGMCSHETKLAFFLSFPFVLKISGTPSTFPDQEGILAILDLMVIKVCLSQHSFCVHHLIYSFREHW